MWLSSACVCKSSPEGGLSLCKMTPSHIESLKRLKKLVSTFACLKGSVFSCVISRACLINTVFSETWDLCSKTYTCVFFPHLITQFKRHAAAFLASLCYAALNKHWFFLVMWTFAWDTFSDLFCPSPWDQCESYKHARRDRERGGPYGLSDSSTTCEGDVKIVSTAWNMNSVLRVWT